MSAKILLTTNEKRLVQHAQGRAPSYTSCQDTDQLILAGTKALLFQLQGQRGSDEQLRGLRGIIAKYLYSGIEPEFICTPFIGQPLKDPLLAAIAKFYRYKCSDFGSWRSNIHLEMVAYMLSGHQKFVCVYKPDLLELLQIATRRAGLLNTKPCFLCGLLTDTAQCDLCGYTKRGELRYEDLSRVR